MYCVHRYLLIFELEKSVLTGGYFLRAFILSEHFIKLDVEKALLYSRFFIFYFL